MHFSTEYRSSMMDEGDKDHARSIEQIMIHIFQFWLIHKRHVQMGFGAFHDLQVFCRLVSHPIAGHNLIGAIWKLACLAPRGHAACPQLKPNLRADSKNKMDMGDKEWKTWESQQ